MSHAKRRHEVDIIRMAALIGICVVNVPFMAMPMESVFFAAGNIQDQFSTFFVESFFQLKFFIIFSFIFGWGMAIQARSAQSRGESFAKRYFRRMLGLAILGVGHATLVFSGDILLLYAILGCLLWIVKDCSPQKLIRIAVWMLPLSMLFLALFLVILMLAVAGGPSSLPMVGSTSLGGGFIEATAARIADWPVTLTLLFFLQSPLAFGAFAVGLAAAKTDFFAPNSAGFHWLQKKIPLLLLVALPLNILYALVMGNLVPASYGMFSFFGFILIAVGAPSLSAIYIYLLIRLARVVSMPEILVLAGRNSLSSYILQGIVAGLVFGAYGLGYFNMFSHAALLPISLIIALAAMVLVGVYAKAFGRGPFEPVLRKISGS
jgi:uncharacterized protein